MNDASFFAKGKNPVGGYGGLKADKKDLTSIFESGSTASQAISAGTYFYLNGTLCYAITNIASGATFTLNTNYEVVTAGALNDLVLKSTVVTLPNLTLNNSGYVSIISYKPSDITPIFAIFENFDGLSSYAGGIPTVNGNMAYLFGMGNLVITKPKIRYFYYK